jgi:glycoprotein endo-alpha-1,2-mannosidase
MLACAAEKTAEIEPIEAPIIDLTPETDSPLKAVDYRLHTFYYNWYGTPEIDSSSRHWAHDILPHWSDHTWDSLQGFPGGENIGANFFPELGNYSCNDPKVIRQHMEQVQSAGIGTVVLSWWGINSFEDLTTPLFLDIAQEYNLKIAFHIEPYEDRTAQNTAESIVYIIDTYGQHPAFYRTRQKVPVFYIYDSYLIPAEDWSEVTENGGKYTLWDNVHNSLLLGLWVDAEDTTELINASFDGAYTYFASDGFTYGSTSANWASMQRWCDSKDFIFTPCVGPGYSDTRIRPWNEANTKGRENGDYYDRMFQAALDAKTYLIAITSFNEWHEGTQIEPAVPTTSNGYSYEDYGTLSPSYYLERTKFWSSLWQEKRSRSEFEMDIDDI